MKRIRSEDLQAIREYLKHTKEGLTRERVWEIINTPDEEDFEYAKGLIEDIKSEQKKK